MSDLIDRIKEQRKFTAKVKHMTFHGTRPTGEQFAQMTNQRITDAQALRLTITDWEGVKESDIMADGSDELVPFSKELFDEAVGDMSDIWAPVIQAMGKAVNKRLTKRQANRKN